MPSRDPFANFERIRREMDELFGDVLDRTGIAPDRGFTPRVDVCYGGDPPRALIKVDLAGVDPDSVAIELRGRELLIAGERHTAEPGNPLYEQVEIEQGPFRRAVELGAEVEVDRAEANYEDGMLRIEIPLQRREQAVRRVPVGGQGEVIEGRPTERELAEGEPEEARARGRRRDATRRRGGERR